MREIYQSAESATLLTISTAVNLTGDPTAGYTVAVLEIDLPSAHRKLMATITCLSVRREIQDLLTTLLPTGLFLAQLKLQELYLSRQDHTVKPRAACYTCKAEH